MAQPCFSKLVGVSKILKSKMGCKTAAEQSKFFNFQDCGKVFYLHRVTADFFTAEQGLKIIIIIILVNRYVMTEA